MNTDSFIEINSIKSCCFTGYRPSKLPFSTNKNDPSYKAFENLLIDGIVTLLNEGCRTFYSGMAMGFDIIAAETVLLLKKLYPSELKLVCVIPFREQSAAFYDDWKERYNEILAQCDQKIILSDDYFSGCYQKRNEYMVKNCDCVMTWFDGRKGGTKNTLMYAKKKGRYVFNINPQYESGFSVQTVLDI